VFSHQVFFPFTGGLPMISRALELRKRAVELEEDARMLRAEADRVLREELERSDEESQLELLMEWVGQWVD
jgi:hypothetical protein